jgi:hypothetical protein
MEPWFWFSSPDEPLWLERECERDREGHRSEDSEDSLDGMMRGEKREGEGEEEGTLEGRDRDGEGRKGDPREGEREALRGGGRGRGAVAAREGAGDARCMKGRGLRMLCLWMPWEPICLSQKITAYQQ